MALTTAALVQPHRMTTTERDLLGLVGTDVGRIIWNTTTARIERWNGTTWHELLTSLSSIDGAKLVGTVDGALLINAVDTALLQGPIDCGTY